MADGGAICGFFPGACPDIARANNGDTIEISGTGMLTIHPNSVGGAGTFKHKDPNGNLLESGTWTAQELVSFVPYAVLSNNFAGGEALIRVHLSSGSDAILTVTCAIGAPPGHTEAQRSTFRTSSTSTNMPAGSRCTSSSDRYEGRKGFMRSPFRLISVCFPCSSWIALPQPGLDKTIAS